MYDTDALAMRLMLLPLLVVKTALNFGGQQVQRQASVRIY